MAGIEFQELLNRYYLQAPDSDNVEVIFNENTENCFENLLKDLRIFNFIKDTIERHLFFDWTLEVAALKTLKTVPPADAKEGRAEIDIINSLKSKSLTEVINNLAEKKELISNLEIIKNKKEKSEKKWKYLPDENSEEDMAWFNESMGIYLLKGSDEERELAFLSEKYFPGIEKIKELIFKDGTALPLQETFIITGFIKELSKKYISEIDDQYTAGVNYYSGLYPPSPDASLIDIKTEIYKGDKNAIKEALKEHYNKGVNEEQQKIINGAKGNVANDKCLIRINYEKLIKAIQWIHQYEADFIKKVIEIFIYDESTEKDVTRSPFFKSG
jgi:hypothetical protein